MDFLYILVCFGFKGAVIGCMTALRQEHVLECSKNLDSAVNMQ